jgi:hypothetical protein
VTEHSITALILNVPFCSPVTRGTETASLDRLGNRYSVQGLRHILVCTRMGAACPSNCNPAEFFIQMLAIVPTREEACRHTIDVVCESFQASEAGQRILAEAGLQGQVICVILSHFAGVFRTCR